MTNWSRGVLVVAMTLLVAVPTSIAATPTVSTLQQRLAEVESRLDALEEDLPDDRNAIGEFTLFDECAYLVGVSSRGDYWFGPRRQRSALFLDLAGPNLPTYDMIAFPAEEPPGIECNEDAEPESTDSG